MASFVVANGNALVPVISDKKVYEEYLRATFWGNKMGTSPMAAIQVSTALVNQQGDTEKFHHVSALSGTGVTGDNTLEGHAEAISPYVQSVEIDYIRHAVNPGGKMTKQRLPFKSVSVGKSLILQWMKHTTDTAIFTALTTSPTSTRVGYVDGTNGVFGNTATSDITSSDVLSLDMITDLAAAARTGNGSRAMPPMAYKNGLERYGFVMSTKAAAALKKTTAYKEKAYYIDERSKENALITGAMMDHDNVLLFENSAVPTALDGASSVRVARNVFFGAQAGFISWGQKTKTVSESFDFGHRIEVAVGECRGIEKAVFNSIDNGVILTYSYDAAT